MVDDETEEFEDTDDADADDAAVVDDAEISDADDKDSGNAEVQVDDSSHPDEGDSDASDGPSQELLDIAASFGLSVDDVDTATLERDVVIAARVLAKEGAVPAVEKTDESESTPAEKPKADDPAPASEGFALTEDEAELLRDRLDDDGYAVFSKVIDRLNATSAELAALKNEHGSVREHVQAQESAVSEQQAMEVVTRFHGLVDDLGMDDIFGKTGEITSADSDAAKARQAIWDMAANLERAAQARGKSLGDDATVLRLAAQAALPAVAKRLQAREIKQKARPGNPAGRSASSKVGKKSGDFYSRVLDTAGVTDGDDEY